MTLPTGGDSTPGLLLAEVRKIAASRGAIPSDQPFRPRIRTASRTGLRINWILPGRFQRLLIRQAGECKANG